MEDIDLINAMVPDDCELFQGSSKFEESTKMTTGTTRQASTYLKCSKQGPSRTFDTSNQRVPGFDECGMITSFWQTRS